MDSIPYLHTFFLNKRWVHINKLLIYLTRVLRNNVVLDNTCLVDTLCYRLLLNIFISVGIKVRIPMYTLST